jgi:hypothetical protein
MSYITLYHFDNQTSEQVAAVTNYVTGQQTSGTTDGIAITVTRSGVTNPDGSTMNLLQRNWSSSEAAAAFITFLNGLNPAPVYAQAVAPL